MSSWLSGSSSARTSSSPNPTPRRISSTSRKTTQDAKMQIDGVAPTFQKKPSIIHEPAGKKLVFECFLEAEPEPNVKWFHNGQALPKSSRFKVSRLRAPNFLPH